MADFRSKIGPHTFQINHILSANLIVQGCQKVVSTPHGLIAALTALAGKFGGYLHCCLRDRSTSVRSSHFLVKFEQRAVTKFLRITGLGARRIHIKLSRVLGDDC
jgi:hypothetical protein